MLLFVNKKKSSHVERDYKTCYNINMNDLGTISGYNSYASYLQSAGQVLPTGRISGDKDEQQDTSAPNLKDKDDINDEATISPEALALFEKDGGVNGSSGDVTITTTTTTTTTSTETSSIGTDKDKLTDDQQRQVEKLKERDKEVKTHEQAHLSAAGGLNASAPTFTYQTGPDGKQYAIGGEVSISFTPTGDPQKDLQAAEAMKSAALAPADPSSQDRSVAQAADKMIVQAQQEILQEKQGNSDSSVTTKSKDGQTTTQPTTDTVGSLATAGTSQLHDNSSPAMALVTGG